MNRWTVQIAMVLCWTIAGCGGTPRPNPAARSPAGSARPLMQIALAEDYPEESRSIQQAGRDLDLLRRAGVSQIRVALGWDGIETQPGQFDWAFWDAYFDQARARNITLLPYVCYTPRWAARSAENHWRQPPKDVAAFGRFMSAAATRYKGRVTAWELWNEPDNREYWEGDVETFARLVKAGSDAVRKADPQARVVLGGLAWETDFLAELLADHDIAGAIDVVNLHSYFETWSPDPIETIPAYVNRVADLIARHGDGEAIWMAETGYSSYRKGDEVSDAYRARYRYEHTPQHQADVLLRTIVLAMSTGRVELLAWYRINDLPPAQEVIGDVNNRHLGLLTTDGKEKPAAEAMRRAVARLGNVTQSLARDTRVMKAIASDAQVHVFARSDGRVIIAGWLQTTVPGSGIAKGGDADDPRSETVIVELQGLYEHAFPTSPMLEQIVPIVVRRGRDKTWVKLPLSAKQTAIYELKPQTK